MIGRSRRWHRAVVVIGVLAGVALPALGLEHPPAAPGDVRDAIAATLRDDDYQTELPYEVSPVRERGADSGSEDFDDDWRWEHREPPSDTPSRTLGLVAWSLLWLIVIATVVLAVAWLVLLLFDPSRRWRARPDESGDVSRGEDPPAGLSAAPLGDAEALAARGEYAEAIHVLLLRTLDELRRRIDTSFADSLTSREIVTSLKMPRAARVALADLVTAVELTYFGGRRPARDQYVRCREHFERFAAAYAGGAA